MIRIVTLILFSIISLQIDLIECNVTACPVADDKCNPKSTEKVCQNDSQCNANQKCCLSGCMDLKLCRNAVPLQCPAVRKCTDKVAKETRKICNSLTDCASSQLCCQDECIPAFKRCLKGEPVPELICPPLTTCDAALRKKPIKICGNHSDCGKNEVCCQNDCIKAMKSCKRGIPKQQITTTTTKPTTTTPKIVVTPTTSKKVPVTTTKKVTPTTTKIVTPITITTTKKVTPTTTKIVAPITITTTKKVTPTTTKIIAPITTTQKATTQQTKITKLTHTTIQKPPITPKTLITTTTTTTKLPNPLKTTKQVESSASNPISTKVTTERLHTEDEKSDETGLTEEPLKTTTNVVTLITPILSTPKPADYIEICPAGCAKDSHMIINGIQTCTYDKDCPARQKCCSDDCWKDSRICKGVAVIYNSTNMEAKCPNWCIQDEKPFPASITLCDEETTCPSEMKCCPDECYETDVCKRFVYQ